MDSFISDPSIDKTKDKITDKHDSIDNNRTEHIHSEIKNFELFSLASLNQSAIP
jgi:hypothetical protein